MQFFPELERGLYNDEAYVFQNDNAKSHKVPKQIMPLEPSIGQVNVLI